MASAYLLLTKGAMQKVSSSCWDCSILSSNTIHILLLAIVPAASCVYAIRRYYRRQKNGTAAALELFHQRHNCVVMYSSVDGMRGWPPYDRIPIDFQHLFRFTEPLTYFIDTALTSLDVAVMTLGSQSICEALERAVQRGVYVRVLVQLGGDLKPDDYKRRLLQAGVNFAFYIPKPPQDQIIMHHKYMIKDYSVKGGGGYLCIGSTNYSSDSSFLYNYEDLVFLTDDTLLSQFQINFEHCWMYTKAFNHESYDQMVLLGNALTLASPPLLNLPI